jgi:ABC-type uncharacterized transport system substrate-binding protein
MFLSSGCTDAPKSGQKPKSETEKKTTAAKKKVLFVNSYHRGYEWSDGIVEGAMDAFGAKMHSDGEIDNSQSKVILKVIYMDTKRNKSEEFKKKAALETKDLIESWQPDVVITSDDNAAKYLIVPYYKDSDLPFVFSGVGLDASAYGFPTKNITGMLEVSFISEMVETLSKYAGGKRIGRLAPDVLTHRKAASHYREVQGITLHKDVYVKTFDEWKKVFRDIQKQVDILLIVSHAGLDRWSEEEAQEFTDTYTIIPTASTQSWMIPYCLLSYSKDPREHGQWAARTALEILEGRSPADIPIVYNRKAGINLNMHLAKKLNITFPIELIEQATFASEREVN